MTKLKLTYMYQHLPKYEMNIGDQEIQAAKFCTFLGKIKIESESQVNIYSWWIYFRFDWWSWRTFRNGQRHLWSDIWKRSSNPDQGMEKCEKTNRRKKGPINQNSCFCVYFGSTRKLKSNLNVTWFFRWQTIIPKTIIIFIIFIVDFIFIIPFYPFRNWRQSSLDLHILWSD